MLFPIFFWNMDIVEFNLFFIPLVILLFFIFLVFFLINLSFYLSHVNPDKLFSMEDIFLRCLFLFIS